MLRRFLSTLFAVSLCLKALAVTTEELREACPGAKVIAGEGWDQDPMIIAHGYGMDDSLTDIVSSSGLTPHHLVGFNFPDYGHDIDVTRPDKLCFGTIKELAPLINLMRACVLEAGAKRLHVYGFSAGGGAVVNALGVLCQHRFCNELNLNPEEMDNIIEAVERGSVLLDCPLKSIDEICDVVEKTNPHLRYIADIYIAWGMRPIDSLLKLEGHAFDLYLHFENPDVILSNRDDMFYIDNLERGNYLGRNTIVLGYLGLHLPCLPDFVCTYQRLHAR
ncbi:MAG: hypothetical protein ACKVOH_04110 [Chlamydiales bacterium]